LGVRIDTDTQLPILSKGLFDARSKTTWQEQSFYRWRVLAKRWQACAWLGVAGVLAFSWVGVRASHYLQTALNPALEGRTLQVVGIVANLPQRMDDSARFRFSVESARDATGTAVSLPPDLLLGWYGQRVQGHDDRLQPPPSDLRPGDRWQLTVRLKAPHGHINPHGFDYELWLWEQNLQATGYVRNGIKDAPPLWLASTWTHPIEMLRERARSASQQPSQHWVILMQLAAGGGLQQPSCGQGSRALPTLAARVSQPL
jgi:predicted membrane metal-binding protein